MVKRTIDEAALLGNGDWPDFEKIVFSSTEKADTVVAIARKMPRLLEYLGWLDVENRQVITERALPWVTDTGLRSAHFRFCDDILNVGTTLGHFVDYALKRGLKRATIAVYARREKYRGRPEQTMLAKQGLTVLKSFDEPSYWQFETVLPQLLVSMGKPYDVDFPIISLPICHLDACRSVEEWQKVLERVFPCVDNLTTPIQRKSGVASFSLLEPLSIPVSRFIRSYEVQFPPIVKVRIYIHSQNKTACIVPMLIPVVPSMALETADIIADPDLRDLYADMCDRVAQGAAFPLEPQYNLLTYFISYEYGRLFLSHFRRLLENLGGGEATVSRKDLHFIFGPDLTPELQDFLTERLQTHVPDTTVREIEPTALIPRSLLDEELLKDIARKLRERNFQSAPVTELVRESLRILDDVIKGNDPDTKVTDYPRLRLGFSLCDLWSLAQELCPTYEKPTWAHLSFLLDYFVDLGVIVPVVGLSGDRYCRVYRRGEADPIEYAEFIHRLLTEHDEFYPNSPLNTTMFTKILAAQAIYHPGLVPIDPLFDFMGTVPYWAQPELVERQTVKALDFLRDQGVIVLEEPEDKDQQLHLFD